MHFIRLNSPYVIGTFIFSDHLLDARAETREYILKTSQFPSEISWPLVAIVLHLRAA